MMHQEGVQFLPIMAGKMRRYFSLRNVIDWFKIPVGFFQAFAHIRRLRPAVVFSKGGYVALPVVYAAWLARVPVIIHESDVRPGLTTRLSSKVASVICISWEATRRFFPKHNKIVLTGVPVRASLLEGDAATGRHVLGIINELPLLLMTGGSLGAGDLNDFLRAQLPGLLEHWNVYHQTGKDKGAEVDVKGAGQYIQQEFAGDGYEHVLAAAEVIFSRAGTTALAEFAALGKKVLLTPLPLDRSRGDQIDNAEAFLTQFPDTTRILHQEELTAETFQQALAELLTAPKPRPAKTKATEDILSLLLNYQV